MTISVKLLTEIRENIFPEKKIVFQGNEIDDQAITLAVEAIKENVYIKSISLIETDMGDQGAILLSTLKNIEEINIHDSKITGIGVKALLNGSFKRLYLRANDIGDEGFEDIENNETLEFLHVGCNRITSKGAEFISRHKKIKHLDFTQNKLDDECAAPLSSMRSLENLILTSNKITNVGASVLEHSSIGRINLAQNSIVRECPPNPILVEYARKRRLEAEARESEAKNMEVEEDSQQDDSPKFKNLKLT